MGAGGHHDVVRKTGWSEKSLNIPVKFAIKNGFHTEALELHFGGIAPGGYAWVFPKNGSSNIGVGIQPKFAGGTSLNILAKQFIDSYSGDVCVKGWCIADVWNHLRFINKSCLLAMLRVWCSLQTDAGNRRQNRRSHPQDNLLDATPLESYEIEWKRQMGSVMSRSKRAFTLGSILFRLPDSVVDMVFNRVTKPFIWRAVTCRSLFALRV